MVVRTTVIIHVYAINVFEIQWPGLPNSSRKHGEREDRITYIRGFNRCTMLAMNWGILNICYTRLVFITGFSIEMEW